MNTWSEKRNRPKIKIGLTLFDLIIEIAGLATVLGMWIMVLFAYSKLPEIIPTHFDAAGVANDFGKKSSIFLLPAIAIVLFACMTVLSMFPHTFNYPVKITENNAFLQYRNVVRMIRCLKLAVVLLFEFIVIQTIRIANGKSDDFSVWFVFLIIGLMFLIMGYFIVNLLKYK